MRILFVHQNLTGQGAEAAEARQMISALADLGVFVGVLYRKVQDTGIKFQHKQITDLGSSRLDCASSTKAVHRFRPDIAHIKSCWTPDHCKVASALRALNVPYVLEPGGHFFDVLLDNRYGGKRSTFIHGAAKRLYRLFYDRPMAAHAAALRTLSAYEAEVLAKRFTAPCFTIPLGFNTEWVGHRNRTSTQRTRATMRFLYLGRLDIFQKGLDIVLRAAAILRDAGKEGAFSMTLAGPGLNNSSEVLHTQIAVVGLNNISLSGPCFGQEKLDLLVASDAFLHVSRFEEMAKLAREATAVGLPVIASRESNYGDWAVQYGFGLISELSATSLATQMAHMIDHPEVFDRLSDNALLFASTHSWRVIAEMMIDMYKKILVFRS